MHRLRTAAWVLAATVLSAASASAQAVEGAESPYRHWDAGAELGLQFAGHSDPLVPLGQWSAEVGHYWTPHLKTTVEVNQVGDGYSFGGAYDNKTWTDSWTQTSGAGFGATATYQFLDNVFTHPYLVFGIRMVSATTTTTTGTVYPNYAVTSMRTEGPRLEAKPVFGGGFKSYFENGRVFMRSEFLCATGLSGSRHIVVRIGAGVDF
jgi:hypothetical protein